MIEAPVSDPIVTAAVEAGQAWANAGLEARLAVLREAGQALADQRDRLDAGLRGDGLSDKLAAYYGDWIVRCGDPDLLERYARDHARWVATGTGGELMVRRPDGLVLLVVPGNSPTLNAATLFTILLPGNAVITRAPKVDAGLRFIVDDVLGGALENHGFSRDLVPVVTSRSRPFLDRFMPLPEVRNVVFFGNSRAGRSVADRAHELGKKVVLELEGSDHMIVWKDADVVEAVKSAVHGFDFSTTPCPIPKHFLVHDAIYDQFLAALQAQVPTCATTIEADPVDGNLIPLGNPDLYDQTLQELSSLGTVVTGGYRMQADGTRDDAGPYAAPTLVAVEAAEVEGRELYAFDEEISFPLIPVVRFRGEDAGIEAAMSRMVSESPFGLRASVWAEDPARIAGFTKAIGHVGLLLFNDEHSQIPAYAAPWGGPRRSGGPTGENHLFWLKTSHLQAIGCQRLD
ncbi:MAG: aldehyde dehydrogenase family protein, partial [Myxococcota bacterium]